jgi:hypothetical protein
MRDAPCNRQATLYPRVDIVTKTMMFPEKLTELVALRNEKVPT